MIAFAGNTVLGRLAVFSEGMDAGLFAVVRTVAGAVVLAVLVLLRKQGVPKVTWQSWRGAGALALYMAGFALANRWTAAGPGALILFGSVQMVMFAGAVHAGETLPRLRVIGALISFGGLLVLLWPTSAVAPPFIGSALMIVAGIGWGLYSLIGRGASDPLVDTARSFGLAVPMLLPLLLLGGEVNAMGLGLAVLSGAVTSALGYALWYAILPELGASRAAVSQLSVPVIAAFGGMIFIAEQQGVIFWLAAALVLGGIALALSAKSAPTRHR